MIKARLNALLGEVFSEGVGQGYWSEAAREGFVVEEPKIASHGDYATNMAMVIAGTEKKLGNAAAANPRALAEKIVALLDNRREMFTSIAIAGPGFINFTMTPAVWQSVVPAACSAGSAFGLSRLGAGRRVLVEFVSANPTGPLSVGHGRQAVLGDAIARLLAATGHDITREYYYNDAGRQMRVLGESTRARYLEALGLPFSFPEDGYQGEYIRDIARSLVAEKGDSLKDHAEVTPFKQAAERAIFEDINGTLKRLDIRFDNYFNEHTLYEDGKVEEVIALLREKGLAYDQEGAVWFRSTEFGLDKDRVIVKSTGEPTYRLPDIAYHREKFRRGFDWMVNIFGSDHIATVPDVMAGVKALGYDPGMVTVVIHQFVTLMREGKQVKMSTRKATFVTVDELVDEVGADVARFFFLMRKADSQLEFDLDLATKQSQENPVYYVQYAHARLGSINRQAAAKGAERGELASAPLQCLTLPEEADLLKAIAAYPSLVESAALALEPHRIVFFLLDLAGRFHSYYNKCRVISEEQDTTAARLWLCEALRIVFKNGLSLIGVTAPETM